MNVEHECRTWMSNLDVEENETSAAFVSVLSKMVNPEEDATIFNGLQIRYRIRCFGIIRAMCLVRHPRKEKD